MSEAATCLFAFSLSEETILLRMLVLALLADITPERQSELMIDVYCPTLGTARILARVKRHSYIRARHS